MHAPPSLPSCSLLARWAGKALCLITGWRLVGDVPAISRAVLIAVPHTSNWDIVYALMTGWSAGVSYQWLVKKKHTQGAFGWLVRSLGGVAVDRSAPQGLVGEAAARFAERDRMLLMVPPAGTRSYRPYWRSGFYWIAREADVPVFLGFLDYATKRASLGPLLYTSGDLRADMDVVRGAYAGIQGKFPDKVSRILLKGEDDQAESSGGLSQS